MGRALLMVLDDQELMRDSLREVLNRAGYSVRTFADPREALRVLGGGGYNLLITDLKMPGMTGLEVLAEVRKGHPRVVVIVITAYGTVETAVEAMRCGAYDYIQKPFRPEEIEALVAKALEHQRLLEENEYLRGEIRARWSPEEIVGRTTGLARVWEQVQRVSQTSTTVFIRGETGTGKELVARAVHYTSNRSSRAFVRVNCAALSAGLLESELFGHTKGAFTGATGERIGRFELADGGSILLDEVSEMSLDLQGKLLRVLQEREFEKVGSSEVRAVDVRVMATSNRDIEKCIVDGKFRDDLFFRLNVVSIVVPPLRERRDDIPALVRYFLAKCHAEYGLGVKHVSDDVLNMLMDYSWPGNVRELANVLERAAVLSEGNELDQRQVEVGLCPVTAAGHASMDRRVRSVSEAEKETILDAYIHFGGKRAPMSEALGISERTLREKLRRYRKEGAIR